MSYPCIICGKIAWYHVGKRNYCGDHKAEAFADRKHAADLIEKGVIPHQHRSKAVEQILHGIGKRLANQRKK